MGSARLRWLEATTVCEYACRAVLRCGHHWKAEAREVTPCPSCGCVKIVRIPPENIFGGVNYLDALKHGKPAVFDTAEGDKALPVDGKEACGPWACKPPLSHQYAWHQLTHWMMCDPEGASKWFVGRMNDDEQAEVIALVEGKHDDCPF